MRKLKESDTVYKFLLFVMKQEGISNLWMRIAVVLGKERTLRYWFKRLFELCDKTTYNQYCKLFEQETLFKMNFIEVEIDEIGLLTGKFNF